VKGKKRILVLTSTFPRWKDDEEPSFVFELCSRLKSQYLIHVLAPHFPGAKTYEYLEGIHIKRFRYFITPWQRLAYQGGILAKLRHNPWQYGLLPFFFLGELFSLIRLLRSYRFHLIHAHWLIPQGLVAVVARLIVGSDISLLCTSHGGDLYGLRGRLMGRIKRWVASKANALTVVSSAMFDEVTGLGADHGRVQVIPMGTDLRGRFVPPRERRKGERILFVGRLVEKKGVEYMIRAFPLIHEKYPGARLRIVGDGPERGVLEGMCAELGLEDRVHFLGAVKNELLPELYGGSDVVVFPSVVSKDGDREGFGLVLVEALGCECATVVTDLPAMRDIIIDGKTGLVVPQKNIQQLAEKVVCLLDDPEMSRLLGKEGRKYVTKRYDWEIIARQYSALIESIT
jgi:glycosyltransferase involved in cell wall biosynthesis